MHYFAAFMQPFKKYFLSCSLLFHVALQSHAQSSVWDGGKDAQKSVKEKKEKTKSTFKDYKEHVQQWGMDTSLPHTLLLGAKANTNGWSGCIYRLKKIKGTTTSKFWQISFSEIKHDKQIKEQGTGLSTLSLGNPSPFVFGKINNLYTLQVGLGKEQLLLPAVVEGNISVSFRYNCGLSLAMLKPYYLKLVYTDNASGSPYLKEEKFDSTNSAKFLNANSILGASKWSKGLNEISYVPGIYFDAAIAIQPGKNKLFVQVITLGANVAIYDRSLPIMADQQAYPWQASLFAGLALGKRW